MKKEEFLNWIEKEETQTRIADAIYYIISKLAYSVEANPDFREEISKAIAMIAEDVEEWRKEGRNKERFVR